MKYMFRDKRDFDVLEGFLSVLLKEDVTIIEILESESNQETKKDKFNRVDIMVKTAKDERIIVEIQNNEEYDYLQRILYGACKTITQNLKKGEAYSLVKKVVSVSIVYFETGQGNDYVYYGRTIFTGLHTNQELLLTDAQKEAFQKETPTQLMPEYYLIQALSFKDSVNDGLDEWIYLFKNSKVEDSFTAKGIDKAKEKLAVAKLPKKKRQEYDQYLKSLHSEASWNETQRIKAEREQRLIKEAEERAQRLIKEAEERAQSLIKEAEERAQRLVKEAEEREQPSIKEAEERAQMERLQTQKNTIVNGLEMGLTKDVIAKMLTITIEYIEQIELELKK
jgi:predicted transposase/invertase (TIGR01784 family)